MSSVTSSPTPVRPIRLSAPEYRAGFLRAVAHLGLDTDGAQRLVEAVTGQPFESCGPAQLQPLIQDLRAIARNLRDQGSRPCGA